MDNLNEIVLVILAVIACVVIGVIFFLLVLDVLVRRITRIATDELAKIKERKGARPIQNKPAQIPAEHCSNCQRIIWSDEMPCVFNGRIVCVGCDKSLRKKRQS